MGKIYTRSGDRGETRLHGGARVAKDDPRIEANGAIDELNCCVGMVRTLLSADDPWQEGLHAVQRELMVVMSLVATPEGVKNSQAVNPDAVADCEAWIDRLQAECADAGWFVLPGGTPLAAWLQLTRTVARRAERRLWTLNRTAPVDRAITCWINRLSDLFFVMARVAVQRSGMAEDYWKLFRYKRVVKNG